MRGATVRARRGVVADLRRRGEGQADEEHDEHEIGDTRDRAHASDRGAGA
jgi:hypothetical protein